MLGRRASRAAIRSVLLTGRPRLQPLVGLLLAVPLLLLLVLELLLEAGGPFGTVGPLVVLPTGAELGGCGHLEEAVTEPVGEVMSSKISSSSSLKLTVADGPRMTSGACRQTAGRASQYAPHAWP